MTLLWDTSASVTHICLSNLIPVYGKVFQRKQAGQRYMKRLRDASHFSMSQKSTAAFLAVGKRTMSALLVISFGERKEVV